MEFYRGPGRLWLRDLGLFNSLPNLKSLTAFDSYCGQVTTDEIKPLQNSHTTKLEMIRTEIPALPLYWYLESFQSLQDFRFLYRQQSGRVGNKERFDPCWIRAALVDHARATLRSLTIHGPTSLDRSMGSLHAFENLQKICTEWEFLFPERHHLNLWPARVLPASLRKFQLRKNTGPD